MLTDKEAFELALPYYVKMIKHYLSENNLNSKTYTVSQIVIKNPLDKVKWKLKTIEYLKEGKYPIVDQGKRLICGFTNNSECIIENNLPFIIFGDHTKNLKFIDFPFAIGADGTKILKPDKLLNAKFFYYSLFDFSPYDKGYSRYYKLLASHTVLIPYVNDIQKSINLQESIAIFLDCLKEGKADLVYFDKEIENDIKSIQSKIIKSGTISSEQNYQLELVDQLRQAFLREAMQGKLVPQDPNDEPASELLKRIKAAKAQLIKEKKLKIGKELPPIKPEEIPYPIPDTWTWCRLGDVYHVTKLAGFEYSEYIKLQTQGEVPVIRAQNVRKGYLELNNLLYIDKSVSLLLERSALVKENILITFIGAGIGDVSLFSEKNRYHLAPNVARAELYVNRLSNPFIVAFLLSQYGQKELFKYKKATAQPSLSMATIRLALIPLPSLSEQKRIVEKLNTLMHLLDELKTSIEQSKDLNDRLLKATLREALTII